ncbi:MAG TPA: hypothetical protein VM573_02795 [Actinomycetota bacterium]|jgi:hypothetical protein|nr:hypothetical protein [Actinomycetota bacterium]
MKVRMLVATLFVAASADPVGAAPREVVWEAVGCEEIVAVVPAQPGSALVALAYRCDSATVGDVTIEDISVSEISLMTSSGSTLLRQVTNSKLLQRSLFKLGLSDSLFGMIEFTPGGPGAAPEVRVTAKGARYSFGGIAAPNAVPPQPSSGGASYTYEGRKGTITLSYENHEQSALPALVTVDASGDRALREWMGSARATAPGVVAAGAWTGRAALEG